MLWLLFDFWLVGNSLEKPVTLKRGDIYYSGSIIISMRCHGEIEEYAV